MIVVIGNQKGGVGKSTLAVNLAVAWQRAGLSVIVIEADPSIHTASRWAEDREEGGYDPVVVLRKAGQLKKTLLDLDRNYDIVLVDSAGKDSPELRSALLAAHVLVVPTQTSQTEIDAVIDMKYDIIDVAVEYNPTLKSVIVLSRVTPHPWSNEAQQTRDVLEKRLPVLSTAIYDRKAYRRALNTGLSVLEGSDPKAAWEIDDIARQIKEVGHGVEHGS